jgi:UDP-N-acetylglucosamine 2-epimerase (non-hydrolysing)
MKEVLNANKEMILSNDILEKEKLIKDKYFLVSIHREENVDSEKNFKELISSLKAIEEEYKFPIIVSTHPRTRKKLESIGYNIKNSKIRFSKPYGFHEYNKLQMNALCVISDSGTITEESSIFNIPAIMIRQAHERPEGMDEGTLIMSGLESENILNSIKVAIDLINKTKIIKDYDVDFVSQKVLKIILSYFHFVNREVWKNY